MGDKSAIEWTDATWNVVTGCTLASSGCAHCWARETHERRHRAHQAGKHVAPQYSQPFGVVQTFPARLEEPLQWRRPRKVFVASTGDLFHPDVPRDFVDRVFAVMAMARRHTFQVLTKRADRMRAYLTDPETFERVAELAMAYQYTGNFDDEPPDFDARDAHENLAAFWPLPNVWLIVSAETQIEADSRIAHLVQTPAAKRGVSLEPLLGPVSFRWAKWDNHAPSSRRANQLPSVERDGRVLAGSVDHLDGLRMLDWIVVGGENGPRPCEVAWIWAIVRECEEAGIALYVKQLGLRPLVPACRQSHWDYRFIKRPEAKRFSDFDATRWLMHPRQRKGADPAEWPPALRVREYPEVRG